MRPYKVKTGTEPWKSKDDQETGEHRWFMDCDDPPFCIIGMFPYATPKAALGAAARARKRLGVVEIKAQQTFEDVASEAEPTT